MADDPVAERSKLLFGNAHLLDVAALIAVTNREVRAQEFERALGLVPSTVHRALVRLTSANLLVRVARMPGEREQRYTKVTHPFWDAALSLRADALEGRLS